MSDKDDSIIDNAIVKELAAKHGKTSPQIIFRWATQQNIAVIPKTSKAERLKENMGLFDWKLSEEDMEKMAKLDINKRYNDTALFVKLAFGEPLFLFD